MRLQRARWTFHRRLCSQHAGCKWSHGEADGCADSRRGDERVDFASGPDLFRLRSGSNDISSLADLLPHAQPMGNSTNAPWQQQQQNGTPSAQAQNARIKSSVPEGLDNAAFGSSSNFFPSSAPTTAASQTDAEGQGQPLGQQNFDPAFWQTLIDKIIT